MKYLLLSIVALFTTAVFAQEDGLNLVVEGGPEITFDKETIDYGTILRNSERERFFTITNTGNEPLIISNCKGSCGCTVPQCPKEPVLPGETSKIKVAYDTNRLGQFTKSVTITSNAADSPTKVVKIKGNVIETEE